MKQATILVTKIYAETELQVNTLCKKSHRVVGVISLRWRTLCPSPLSSRWWLLTSDRLNPVTYATTKVIGMSISPSPIFFCNGKINIFSVNKNQKIFSFSHRAHLCANFLCSAMPPQSRVIFCANMCAYDFFCLYQDLNPQSQPRMYPSLPLSYTITCD